MKRLTDWIDAAAEEFYNANVLRTTCAFKAGANAAIEKLQEMGVGEFDAYTDLQDYWFTLDHRKIMNLEAHEIAKHFAKWQHAQTASILAAKDEQLARLKSELSKLECQLDKSRDTQVYVIAELMRRGAKVEALLREITGWCVDDQTLDKIDQYFSE